MAVTERAVTQRPVREVVQALQDALARHDQAAAEAVLDQLGAVTDETVESGDVRRIAVERDRLDRVARALRDVPGHVAGAFALGYLADADRRLDRARTKLLGEHAAERREREASGVRERVLALLDEPRRPREIADALGCDPSQVSRALRELREQGRVAVHEPPAGGAGDRR
ncbi:MAG TPA: helix-turn-helix domain-containing protein, partial [Solirubrobacteraceae bacterium]|nr:helix-turn-helix domain-containing protein [Solirubrobacteraceae bacterium]